MHKHFVINIIARIVLIGCFVMLIPFGIAVFDDVHSQETAAFKVSILTGMLLSIITLLIFRLNKKDYSRINAKDGLAIVGLSWICLSAIGAMPLYHSGVVATYTDAFFEIASGFTTTGATIFVDVEILPRGILFWRSLTHWLGGMGVIVLYIALLPALGSNATQLYKAEAPGLTVERLEPRIKETAKNLWTIYFLLSFGQVVLMYAGGMNLFDSLCHTFGTVATGGFSTKNASMAAYSPYLQWVTILFMFLAGTNFVLHYQAFKGKPVYPFKNEEFDVYFFTIIICTALFAFVLGSGAFYEASIREGMFQIVAILTTTGFTSADFDLWPSALKFILFLLMFAGGCGGSTGGGMKIVRVYLSIKIAFRSMIQAVFPNAIVTIKFNKKVVSDRLIMGLLSYFIIYMFLFFNGALLITFTENCDLLTAFSASLASLSNIGPGFAKVGATQNYAWFSVPGKWVLTFLMLAGRLELYSILILLVPQTWKK